MARAIPNAIRCHHQNDSCIRTGRDESHVYVSLIKRVQCDKTVFINYCFWKGKGRESQAGKSNRHHRFYVGDVSLPVLASLTVTRSFSRFSRNFKALSFVAVVVDDVVDVIVVSDHFCLCTHTHTRARAHTYTHVLKHTRSHARPHARTHTQTHTHTHSHTHAHRAL